MKKLVLVLVLMFSINMLKATNHVNDVTSINSGIDKLAGIGGPDFCWSFADAVETQHCGSVGCDTDWWFYVYDTCMEMQ